MKKLTGLLLEYNKQYPKAENPLQFMAFFGIKGMTAILENADGREIEFSRIPNTTGMKFKYKTHKK